MSANAAATATAAFTPSTSPSTLTLRQRWTRFVDDELVSFAVASSAYTAAVLAKEYHGAAHAPRRMQQALTKTRALLPAIALSAAVGIAGMKLSIAAVSHAREDYTRTSVLLAFPLAGALLQMQHGPRAMAVGALGFGALGYGADSLFARWHRRSARLAEQVADDGSCREHHHDSRAFHFAEPFAHSSPYLLESSQK